MTYVYGLFHNDECFYVGQTKDFDKRKQQHLHSIEHKCHSVKALNKLNITDVEMRVIDDITVDNSFIIMLTEALYNSIYKPKNGIVWQCGRNTVRFKRIDVELAERLLKCMESYTN